MPALLEQLQKHHVGHEAALRVAAYRSADVQPQKGSVGADRLACDSDALERLMVIAGEAIGEQPVIVESLEAELIGEDEPVGEVAEDGFLRADGSGADSVNALRSEEAELVFSKAIEPLPVEVIQLHTDALELREIKALGHLAAEVSERLLIRIVFGQDAPWLPRRAFVIVEVA